MACWSPGTTRSASAAALLSSLQSPEKRARMSRVFRKRVEDVNSEGAVMRRIVGVYDRCLNLSVRVSLVSSSGPGAAAHPTARGRDW